MQWNEVMDPTGSCNIRADLSILKDYYTPEEAQRIINKEGVKAFSEVANTKLRNKSKGRALSYITGNPDELIDVHFTLELVG